MVTNLERITPQMVQELIKNKQISDTFNKIAEEAVNVVKNTTKLDQNSANNIQIEQIFKLQSYQSALLQLCLDGILDFNFFVNLMQGAYQKFQLAKETQNLQAIDPQTMEIDQDENLKLIKENGPLKRDIQGDKTKKNERNQFSYGILEAIWIASQKIQGQQQNLVGDFNFKVKEILRRLTLTPILSQSNIFEVLDPETLEACDITKKDLFHRSYKAFFTYNFFGQKKFNLLREENEGFAKLIIELNQPNINEENVDIVFLNVQKLIGYFQLDPNRTVDILLTAFEADVQNRAFLKLLQNLGSRSQITQLVGQKIALAQKQAKIGVNGLPTEFKDMYERIIDATDDDLEDQPEHKQIVEVDQNLFDLTAMLLKFDLVTLDEIWPYFEAFKESQELAEGEIADDKDEIESFLVKQNASLEYQYSMLFKTIMNQEKFEAEMRDQMIDVKHDEIQQTRVKLHQNFKVRLLHGCIRVNDWQTADLIVNGIYQGRFDFTVSRGLMQSMHHALDWFLEKVYRNGGNSSTRILQNRFVDPNRQTTTLDRQIKIERSEYRNVYYVDNNPKSIQRAKNESDFFENLPKIMQILGVYVAFDEKVFIKLLKSVYIGLKRNPSFKQYACQLVSDYFLPALSLVENNVYVEQALWNLLKDIDHKQRYAFYTQILQQKYLSKPCLVAKLILVQRNCANWARRLDIDFIKQKTKQLFRFGCGNSLLVFDLIVTNAKAYENQIEAQIQAISLFPDLSLDMMAFTIVKHLADTKDPMLDMNQNTAKWLTNLSDFTVQFFNRYPHVDLTGLLSFVVNRMQQEKTFEYAFMVDQIISRLFGWSDLEVQQLTSDHLDLLSAGFMLTYEAKNAIQGSSKTGKSSKKSSEALCKILWDQSNSTNSQAFGYRLMTTLSMLCQHVKNELETEDLLLVSRQYDRLQTYFNNFVDTLAFLAEQNADKFALLLPKIDPIDSLSLEISLPLSHIFQILRQSLKPIVNQSESDIEEQACKFKRVADNCNKNRLLIGQKCEDTEMNDYFDELKFLEDSNGESKWQTMSPKLYCIFWSLSLEDLIYPEQEYTIQINKIKEQISQIKKGDQEGGSDQKIDGKRKNQSVDKLNKLIAELEKEIQKRQQHVSQTHEFLQSNIVPLFKENDPDKDVDMQKSKPHQLSVLLLQHCFIPRVTNSPKDAYFVITFFKLLHKLRVPNFNFLNIFGLILKQILPMIHFCSENEAENLGIFFHELFKMLHEWSDKQVWDRDCANYSGFAKQLDSPECISHHDFVQIISNSINKRFMRSINFCFNVDEKFYMKTRCSLIILNRMTSVFPSSFSIAQSIQKQLQILVDAQGQIRQDLWTLACRCNENLKQKISKFPEHIALVKAEQERQKKLEEKQKAEKEAKIKAEEKLRQSQKSARDHHQSRDSRKAQDAPERSQTSRRVILEKSETSKDSRDNQRHNDKRQDSSRQENSENPKSNSREQQQNSRRNQAKNEESERQSVASSAKIDEKRDESKRISDSNRVSDESRRDSDHRQKDRQQQYQKSDQTPKRDGQSKDSERETEGTRNQSRAIEKEKQKSILQVQKVLQRDSQVQNQAESRSGNNQKPKAQQTSQEEQKRQSLHSKSDLIDKRQEFGKNSGDEKQLQSSSSFQDPGKQKRPRLEINSRAPNNQNQQAAHHSVPRPSEPRNDHKSSHKSSNQTGGTRQVQQASAQRDHRDKSSFRGEIPNNKGGSEQAQTSGNILNDNRNEQRRQRGGGGGPSESSTNFGKARNQDRQYNNTESISHQRSRNERGRGNYRGGYGGGPNNRNDRQNNSNHNQGSRDRFAPN